jgi:hypothetical protein
MIVASLLVAVSVLAGEPDKADQKWLEAVQKMVSSGQTGISTPSEGRVQLLKDWAGKRGYSVEVTKSETHYRVELSKKLAQK